LHVGLYGHLLALSAHSASQLHVAGEHGDAFGVNGAQVCVFKQANEVGLPCLLQGKDSRSLETKIALEILRDLTDKSLERKLADEELGGLLVTSDLTKSDGSGSVSVGLLDTASGRGALAGGLGGELLAGSLASSGLSCGLLGAWRRREHNRERGR